jgi:thymidylate synthase
MIEEPVIITYTHPRERVLFNQARDANPFLHLYESLWMLAGRNDVAPLKYYVNTIDQFSDDGKTLNGAYGYRWRHAEHYEYSDPDSLYRSENIDQLQILIQHLKAQPESRRAVLQMWNVEDDLLKIGRNCSNCGYPQYNSQHEDCCPDGNKHDNVKSSKDLCCNLSVMFSIREERNSEAEYQMAMPMPTKKCLDMTVTNRSNDMIWGMLGANVVHFSFLQEYMAAHLGCEVGVYNQFTNNLHVYEKGWEPDKWLDDKTSSGMGHQYERPKSFPLIKDPAVFDKELPLIVQHYSHQRKGLSGYDPIYREPFLATVAEFMFLAFQCHKARAYDNALKACSMIAADDWRIASVNWIEKRKRMYENRKGAPYTQGVTDGGE